MSGRSSANKAAVIGVGILGVSFGAALGAATKNVALGVAFGAALSVAFGLIFGGADSETPARKQAAADKPLPHPLGL